MSEQRDINIRAVAGFIVGLLVVAVVVHVLMWLLFDYFAGRATREDPPRPPLSAGDAPRLPPEPRLQTTPVADLQRIRRDERARLETYGWIDRTAGTVHMPIDRAMQLLLERGLPPTTSAPPPAPAPPAMPPVVEPRPGRKR